MMTVPFGGHSNVSCSLTRPRKKKPPSRPHGKHSSSQKPARTRKPDRTSSLMSSVFPNKIVVDGAPSTPAMGRGVPAGELVTSAGTFMPRVHQSRYSADPHTRPYGPQGPFGPQGPQVV